MNKTLPALILVVTCWPQRKSHLSKKCQQDEEYYQAYRIPEAYSYPVFIYPMYTYVTKPKPQYGLDYFESGFFVIKDPREK